MMPKSLVVMKISMDQTVILLLTRQTMVLYHQVSRITANGNIGMGTSSPKNNLDVENNVAIGQNYSGSKDAPVNGLLVEGMMMGISNSYMNNFASVSQPSEQLWVNVSPSNTSYNYGII